jgi:hypothetical protein
VRSPDNADLASGSANVMVPSPLGGRSRTPPERGADPAGQFEGLRRPPEWGTDLASQVEGLRKQDSRVEAITPGRRFPSRNGNPLRTPDLTGQQERLVELGISPERIYLDHGLTGTSRLRLVPRSLPAPPAQ